jgi:hypothetical protein
LIKFKLNYNKFILFNCYYLFEDDEDDDEEGNGDGDGEGEGSEGGEKPEREPKTPSLGDYFIHFLSLFWKVLFAFVPPTDIAGGWACFVVSILIIGVLTAFIGDVAAHFGCTIGLKDSVTAISFVALGTSLPGELNLDIFLRILNRF